MTTAPVFVVDAGALGAASHPAVEVVLDGPEGRHAAKVRRVRVGETVDVVDGMGTRARCVVTGLELGRVALRVTDWSQEPPSSPRVVVVQALAKGDRGERAVELMTEVGVDEVVPWAASRSIVQWNGERGERALQRWRSTARESSKQARRAWFTDVGPLATMREVAARLQAADLAAVLTGEAPVALGDVTIPTAGEVVLVVGPEGDITEQELAAFDAAGARRVSLGPTVLRTSTAGVVAAAVALSRTRW